MRDRTRSVADRHRGAYPEKPRSCQNGNQRNASPPVQIVVLVSAPPVFVFSAVMIALGAARSRDILDEVNARLPPERHHSEYFFIHWAVMRDHKTLLPGSDLRRRYWLCMTAAGEGFVVLFMLLYAAVRAGSAPF